MNDPLIRHIEHVISMVRHYRREGYRAAAELESQLLWCLNRATGETLTLLPDVPQLRLLLPAGAAPGDAFEILQHHLEDLETQMEQFEMQALQYAALSA